MGAVVLPWTDKNDDPLVGCECGWVGETSRLELDIGKSKWRFCPHCGKSFSEVCLPWPKTQTSA